MLQNGTRVVCPQRNKYRGLSHLNSIGRIERIGRIGCALPQSDRTEMDDVTELRDHDGAELRDHDLPELRERDLTELRDHDVAELRGRDLLELRDKSIFLIMLL